MASLLKNALLGLGLLAIIAFGYILFFGSDDESPLSEGTEAGAGALETQQFLIKLQELRSVTIETDFFNDERFTALEDFRQDLPPQNTGRANPFAPAF